MKERSGQKRIHRGSLQIRRRLALFLTAALFLSGCAGEDASWNWEEEHPEASGVQEPADAEKWQEAAAYRNLYDAQIYEGNIIPDVQEYAFPVNVTFDRFAVSLGMWWRRKPCWRMETRRPWMTT